MDEADSLTKPAANAIVNNPKATETDMTTLQPLHGKADETLHP